MFGHLKRLLEELARVHFPKQLLAAEPNQLEVNDLCKVLAVAIKIYIRKFNVYFGKYVRNALQRLLGSISVSGQQ